MALEMNVNPLLGGDANSEISKLSSKLSQVSDKFINQWTGEGLVQYLKQNTERLRQFIQQAEDQIEQTKKDIEDLRKQASDNQLAVADQQSKAKEIEEAIREAESKTEQLLFQKEQWEKQLVEETRQCKEQSELLEAQEKATKKRLESLYQAEQFFKDRIGLEFRKLDGDHLQLVFTNVDSKAHDRSFYITIMIDKSQYLVTDCNPKIEGVPEILEELNKTNNLMKFVVEVRKRFKLMT